MASFFLLQVSSGGVALHNRPPKNETRGKDYTAKNIVYLKEG